MTTEELEKNLEIFLEANRPIVCLKAAYHIIFRRVRLLIVKSSQLRIGDIRIVMVEAENLVKGLTPDEWTILLSKTRTLVSMSRTNIFTGSETEPPTEQDA